MKCLLWVTVANPADKSKENVGDGDSGGESCFHAFFSLYLVPTLTLSSASLFNKSIHVNWDISYLGRNTAISCSDVDLVQM